jgi:phosphonate transport system substrate-binding protein
MENEVRVPEQPQFGTRRRYRVRMGDSRHPSKAPTVLAILSLILAACGDAPRLERGAPTPPVEAAASADRPVLTFGVYATDTPRAAVEKFRPLLDALELDLTRVAGSSARFKTNVHDDYQSGIDAIVHGESDVTRTGPASFILSIEREPDLQLIAMELTEGRKTFYGIVCVHEDSPIRSVEELVGRSFAFGSENSTSRFLAQRLLVEAGVHATDLSRFSYLGRHDLVGHAVGQRRFDAGALKESTFRKLREENVPIRELARFPIVGKPWFARAGLDRRLVEAIRASLLRQEDPAVLRAAGRSGFAEATLDDYAVIRDSIATSHRFFSAPIAKAD